MERPYLDSSCPKIRRGKLPCWKRSWFALTEGIQKMKLTLYISKIIQIPSLINTARGLGDGVQRWGSQEEWHPRPEDCIGFYGGLIWVPRGPWQRIEVRWTSRPMDQVDSMSGERHKALRGELWLTIEGRWNNRRLRTLARFLLLQTSFVFSLTEILLRHGSEDIRWLFPNPPCSLYSSRWEQARRSRSTCSFQVVVTEVNVTVGWQLLFCWYIWVLAWQLRHWRVRYSIVG